MNRKLPSSSLTSVLSLSTSMGATVRWLARSLLIAVGVLATGAVGACTTADETTGSESHFVSCRVDADCPGGYCANGVCRDWEAGAGGMSASDGVDAAAEGSTFTDDEMSTPEPSPSNAEPSPEGSVDGGGPDPAPQTPGEDAAAPRFDTGQEAGTPATDDEPTLTTQEICENSCATTAPLSMPAAFCEDFRLYPSQVYQYCDLPRAETCRDDCIARMAVVKETCAAVLPHAVECMARSGFYGGTAQPFLPEDCFFGCFEPMLTMSVHCGDYVQDLSAARQRWTEQGLASYSFEYRADSTTSSIQVVDGVGTVVMGDELDDVPTIDSLFDDIEEALARNDDHTLNYAEYDPEMGYPIHAGQDFSEEGLFCGKGPEWYVSELTPTSSTEQP